MAVEGGRKRQAIAGASGAIEEAYRQGLAAHALKHNKVRFRLSMCGKEGYPRVPCTKRSDMDGTTGEGGGVNKMVGKRL